MCAWLKRMTEDIRRRCVRVGDEIHQRCIGLGTKENTSFGCGGVVDGYQGAWNWNGIFGGALWSDGCFGGALQWFRSFVDVCESDGFLGGAQQ